MGATNSEQGGESLTCGEALVRLLENYGVDTVFGIPGTQIVELYRGLNGSSIRHVLARHEQGAGFMADGYARVTGRPGVCFVIGGPGLLNTTTPIATAHNDSIPLLIISADAPLTSRGKGWGEGHEMRDQRGLTASITGFSATAYRPGDLPDLIAKAFASFATARPRPVHIEIPADVLSLPVSLAEFDRNWRRRAAGGRPTAPEACLKDVAARIDRSDSPVLLVGGGARDATAEILALAERLSAPVINTVGGIGLFPGSHPLALSAAMSFEAGRDLATQSDLLIAVGTEMGNIDSWYAALAFSAELIRIDIDPQKLTDHYPAAQAVLGDAQHTLAALVALCRPAPAGRRAKAEARVAAIRQAMTASLSDLEAKHLRLLETIRGAVPGETLFYGDMTQIAYTATRIARFDHPGQLVQPLGFGCLGFALPAGIGGKIGRPGAPVVILAGDSGILYTVQEMATALDENAPVVVVVWNNRCLGEIRDGFVSRGIQPIAVTPTPADHQGLAQAFGWQAKQAEDHPSLGAALQAAIQSDAPTLIEVFDNEGW